MRLSKTLAASAALLLGAAITAQADEPSHIPATAQSQANAAVIAKADHALRDSVKGLSNVWIFATGDASSVFVSYTTDTNHLALVEMKGEHIANLRDLNTSAEQVLTASTHVLTGRRAAEGEEVVAGIRKDGGTALFIQADLTRIETIPDIINRTVANFGRLDGAFNNAGVTGGGPIETLDEARRLAEPEEMAQVALFLLSDRASYVSGQSIVVDGGQSAT